MSSTDDDSGILAFFQKLTGRLQLLIVQHYVGYRSVKIGFYYVEMFPPYLLWWVKCFSPSLWDDRMVFSFFLFADVVNHADWLMCWTTLGTLGQIQLDCSIWSVCCWIWFANIVLRVFHLNSSKIWPVIIFWYWLWFVSGWWYIHRLTFGSVSPSAFWKRVWEGLICSRYVWQNSPVKPSVCTELFFFFFNWSFCQQQVESVIVSIYTNAAVAD